MSTGAGVAGNGEASSSAQNNFNAESSESSDLDDPVLAHDRERALLENDFLEHNSNNPSVAIVGSPDCVDTRILGYLSKESRSCQAGYLCPTSSYHCRIRVYPPPTIDLFPPLGYVGYGNSLPEALPTYLCL